MLLKVDPAAFVAASERIGHELAVGIESVYQTLSQELGECTIMAGSDSAGRRFSNEYDQAGPRAAIALADLDTAARRIGSLLQATGFNHAQADRDSGAHHVGRHGDRREYDVSPASQYGLPGGTGAIVPSAAGGSGHRPGGWGLIEAIVGWEWPNGRQDLLHRAAHAWRHAAYGLAGLTGSIDDARSSIAAQQSPEVPDALTVCADLRAGVLDASAACASLADACERLAERITKVHDSITAALKWLVTLSAATQVVGAVGAIFTFGLAEGAAQTAEAAEVRAVATEVAAYISTFFHETGEIALLVSRVDAEVLAVSRSLQPILAASIRTVDTQVVAALPGGAAASPALARLAVVADYRATFGQRLRGYWLDGGDTGAISLSGGRRWTVSARVRHAGLPSRGPIRFIPARANRTGAPLYRGTAHGYMDQFGNQWVKGPSRTPGEPFEWDVILSPRGRASIGWLSRDGVHVNVSLEGWVTH